MRPSEHNNTRENKTSVRGKDYSFFFFEQRGNRSYLRFTPLGVTVIVFLTVVPVILILVIVMIRSRQISDMNINTNITTTTPTPYPANMPIIIQQPTPMRPPKIRQQPMNVPNPLRESPVNNINENKPTRPPATNQNSNSSANHR
jgi:hypothetical protein